MKRTEWIKVSALSGVILTMVTGCTPSEPMSPVLGPESERVILYILVLLVGYLLWRVYMNRSETEEDRAENDLEHINSRLDTIEKDIQKIKSNIKGKDHDER